MTPLPITADHIKAGKKWSRSKNTLRLIYVCGCEIWKTKDGDDYLLCQFHKGFEEGVKAVEQR